jgi:hypothetical protein
LKNAVVVTKINIADRNFLVQTYQLTRVPAVMAFHSQKQDVYEGKY